jgi:hypothetical protein
VLALANTNTVRADSNGRPATLPERLKGAARVVVARAATVRASWHNNQYGDRLIVSRILLQVEETLKGAPGQQIVMDLEGGTLDGYTLHVSSLPSLTAGERAVFFLEDTGSNVFRPHLRGQGILKLDDSDVVRGSSLRLGEIRDMARQTGR